MFLILGMCFQGRKASSGASSTSSRLKKSRSSQQLSSSNEKISLSPPFSALIRKELASIMECRLLAKCLKDTASKAMNGDLPSVNRLLGCRSIFDTYSVQMVSPPSAF